MVEQYNPQIIEQKWQPRWAADQLYKVSEDPSKPKWYFLTMYPYPSGTLHIGHWFMFTAPDALARYMRMRGYNVLFPQGFDSFGLPAENAAIKHGIHPKTWTYDNIATMRRQFESMGASYNWERMVITSDDEYARWTQWLFNQFFKHGLAYRTFAPVDWCPNCNTTLAREQVVGEERVCERCGTPVIKKDLDQWLFRITKYADELLDFTGIDWPERVRVMQTNWIGRSEGAEVTFKSEEGDDIVVFTTRPDTLWGATFMVLAPEHPLVEKLTSEDRRAGIEAYVTQARRETEIERLDATREKTGVFIGAYALNPVNGERIPIWIADYVLLGYGTGAIMAVPAHDQRDFEFARQYGLKIAPVIQAEGEELPDPDTMPAATTRKGVMVNSGPLTGTPADKAVRQAIAYLEEQGLGKGAVNYRIRDWLISRQRYWGAPIPMIHCPKDGTVPVPDDQLPVTLPEDIDFRPTGESPLKYHPTWRFTTCPVCGGPAERDTDTMDTFVDSSWYWYRYCSPHDDQAFMDPEKGRYWLPVDQYAGGIEHATMHLLYARFFHKALRDMGLVWGDEPFLRLFNQGLILGPDGEKMSKSRGNVIDPDAEVAKYGADVVRVYLMFLGPWSKGGPWKTEGVEGPMRWLQRVWRLVLEEPSAAAQAGDADLRELRRRRHKAIQKVGEDISRFEFNTAIASLMEYTNFLIEKKATSLAATPDWTEASRTLLLLVAPFAPHLAEELWERLGYAYSIHQQPWPAYDPELAKDEEITLPVQINGKLRDKVTVPADVTEEQVRELVLARDKVRATIDSQQLAKWIYVPGRLVNLVVR